MACRILLIWAAVALLGCKDDPRSRATVGSFELEGPAQVATALSEFTLDDSWRVGPAHRGGSPMQSSSLDRVAALVEINDSMPIEIGVRSSGESEWTILTRLGAQGALQVYTATLPSAADELEIGVREEDAERVVSLRWTGASSAPSSHENRSDQEPEPAFAGVPITSRSSWSAAPSRCAGAEDESDEGKSGISLHMSVTDAEWDPASTLQALQGYFAPGLGFCDLGFHFVVAPDGTVYEGRPLTKRAAHAAANEQVAIGFLGCLDSAHCADPDDVTEAAKQSAGGLMASLAELFEIELSTTTVVAPNGCGGPSSDCAGDRLVGALGDILEAAGGTTTPPVMDSGMPIEDATVTPPDVPTGQTTCDEMGCDWCNSSGSCLSAGESCSWVGEISGDRCWSTLDACATLTCWDPALTIPGCGTMTMSEDFSTGRFALHQYASSLQTGGPVTISLQPTGGSWQPALIITDSMGGLISAGDVASIHPSVSVTAAQSGRMGSAASVTLMPTASVAIRVHVTSWEVVDAGFMGMLPTDATYDLSSSQTCSGMMGPSASESVGSPASGTLENGVRITEHPGYVIYENGRNGQYGTEETIRWVREGFDAVRAMHPTAARAQIHDISVQGGGTPSGEWPHASHQSGRDVDITYILNSCGAEGCPFDPASPSTLNVAATWTLFEHWIRNGLVTYIFVDHSLQQVLHEEAERRGASASELTQWIQWPRAIEVREGFVRHVDNHLNHIHVRFRCPDDDSRCVE